MLEVVFQREEKNMEKSRREGDNLAVSIGFLFCTYYVSIFLQTTVTFRNKIQLCTSPVVTAVLFLAQPSKGFLQFEPQFCRHE